MMTDQSRRDLGWISFDGPVPGDAVLRFESEALAPGLLLLTAALPSGCKYALSAASGLRVRGEWPKGTVASAERRAVTLEAGFIAATQHLAEGMTAPHEELNVSPVDEPLELANLCRDAGWSFDTRSDAALVLDLGVNGAYVPAIVAVCDSGIASEVELVRSLPGPGVCRTALATFLLRVNGAFRMARSVFRGGASEGESARAVLEAPLPADATAAELNDALGALAVVARHCALEAQLIATDARIARAYLDLNELPGLVGRKSATKQGEE